MVYCFLIIRILSRILPTDSFAGLWTSPDSREDDMKDENKGIGKRCGEGARENK